jgi:hypothetical protein
MSVLYLPADSCCGQLARNPLDKSEPWLCDILEPAERFLRVTQYE